MGFMEGRFSDSPYIQTVWRGEAGANYTPVCPADPHWNMLFLWNDQQTRISIEGPASKATPKTQAEGVRFLVIRFHLGVFMPSFPILKLRDADFILPKARQQRFHFHSSTWEIPHYDNVEDFVEGLIRDEVLMHDSLVQSALDGHSPDYSERTVRRRFLRATGLAPKTVQQIERAQLAMQLLEQKQSILDVAYRAGYADQAHLTRELKRFIGRTPAQVTSPSIAIQPAP